jgi:alpha-1,2-mannosyltransferase
MSPRRQAVIVAATSCAVLVFLVTVPRFRHFFDLGVYRGAVRYWLVDGGRLYDFRYDGTGYGFTYPPFAALVLSPLAVLAWPVAIAASIAVNAAAVALVVRRFVLPVVRARGRLVWMPCVLAFCAVLLFEPTRDTFSFGQVNLVLLVLVFADVPDRRWAGVGVGLAAAIKLTPVLFIGYLLIARRYRAAAVAAGVAVGATVLAALVSPSSSRAYWTDAVWHTDRIGRLAYVSNQSLLGAVARSGVGVGWWPVVGCVVLVLWWIRARAASTAADHTAGFALTAVTCCLVSPVTWVHHLVWLLPALFLLLRVHVGAAAAIYVVMCSSVVWLWLNGPHGWIGIVGSSGYVWVSVVLLLLVPISARAPAPDNPTKIAATASPTSMTGRRRPV